MAHWYRIHQPRNLQTLIKSEIRGGAVEYFFTVQAIGDYGVFVWHGPYVGLEDAKVEANLRSGCPGCVCEDWRDGEPRVS